GLLWNWLHGQKEQPRFRVRIASIDGRPVTSIHGVGLMPQCAIRDIKCTDIIILSASSFDFLERMAKSRTIMPWLRKWHANGATIAGICSGVAFLAECGLLDGRRATTHWAV